MMRREFGQNGAALPVLGLSCRPHRFVRQSGADARHGRALLERSLDLGVNLLDTADIYGQGDSEREIGELLAGRRDRAFVVTKVGKRFSRKMRLMRPLKPLLKPLLAKAKSGSAVVGQRDANLATDFSPAAHNGGRGGQPAAAGLRSVDALLLHSPPATEITPDVGEALAALKKAGKVRHFGISATICRR